MDLKFIFLVIIAPLLHGCATLSPYESVESGPKSKLNFISPTLEGFFLADTDLDLQIYEADTNCKMSAKGRVQLEPDQKEKFVFIPANQYIYLNVKYFQNCFGCGARSGNQQFTFLPESGKEYTVEYTDKALNFNVSIYEGPPGDKVAPVEALRWNKCKSLHAKNI